MNISQMTDILNSECKVLKMYEVDGKLVANCFGRAPAGLGNKFGISDVSVRQLKGDLENEFVVQIHVR